MANIGEPLRRITVVPILWLAMLLSVQPVAAWDVAASFQMLTPERCQTVQPGLKICFTMLEDRNDVGADTMPRGCEYLAISDKKRISFITPYEVNGHKVCAGTHVPLFYNKGPEQEQVLGKGSIRFQMALNLNDPEVCWWVLVRDPNNPSRVQSAIPYKLNGKQVCYHCNPLKEVCPS